MSTKQRGTLTAREGRSRRIGRIWISVLWILLATAPVLAQTAYPPHLPTGANCSFDGTGPYRTTAGVGHLGQGADVAFGDINRNGKLDMVLMAYDNPTRGNSFRYRIGWDVNLATGAPASWKSSHVQVSGVGWEGQGAGIGLADIDGNGRLDMVLMAYDNPAGANEFRYKIGWNLRTSGSAASWSSAVRVAGVGHEGDGAALALADIDDNGTLDLVLMAYDDPAGSNSFRYKIGWNLSSTGTATSWSGTLSAPGLGSDAAGAGMVIADIDMDRDLDLVFMAYDEGSDDWNTLRYRIGWQLGTNGQVKEWSRWFLLRGMGTLGDGAGLAYYVDTSGATHRPTLCFMVYDAPGGANNFRWAVHRVTTSGATFGVAEHHPPAPTDFLIVPGTFPFGDTPYGFNLFNLNMSLVQDTAEDALTYFVFGCFISALLGQDSPACQTNWPDTDVNWATIYSNPHYSTEMGPDLLVAAVAYYVDHNMGYVGDDANSYVLNTIFGLNYPHGAEAMPAYYTLHYTNPTRHSTLISQLQAHNPSWAQGYNDGRLYHGDCEDFAILRHSLLRALGFNRDYIWDAGSPGHEFNVVLFKGTYRIMDYGRIDAYLCRPSGITVGIDAVWNETHGPRFGSDCRTWFKELVLDRVWPDRCGAAGAGWSFSRLHRSDFEGKSKCQCN